MRIAERTDFIIDVEEAASPEPFAIPGDVLEEVDEIISRGIVGHHRSWDKTTGNDGELGTDLAVGKRAVGGKERVEKIRVVDGGELVGEIQPI